MRKQANEIQKAVGEVLRRIRRSRGMTMRDVESRSHQLFKASVLSGYERGDRSISLRRFWELARFYEVPPDRLLAEIARAVDPASRAEVVLDLSKLELIDASARRSVTEFADQVRSRRGDYLSDVITLRSGDLEVLAFAMKAPAQTVADRLAPALRRSADS